MDGISTSEKLSQTIDVTGPAIHDEIDDAHVYGVQNLAEQVFPDTVLGFPLLDAFEATRKTKGRLRYRKDTSRWSGFPDLPPAGTADAGVSEGLWCDFLNDMAKFVAAWYNRKHNGSSTLTPRRWSAAFANKPLGSTESAKDEPRQRKPDGFMYDPAELDDPNDAQRCHTHGLFELRCGQDGRPNADAFTEAAENAHLTFGAQDERRFILGITVVEANILQLHLFDRSGVLSSERIDIHKNPRTFLRIVCGFAFADSATLGYDPNIKWVEGKRILTALNEKFEILDVLHCASVIRGRGTVCYKVKHIITGRIFVYKTSWIDVARKEKEWELLKDADDINFISHLAKLEYVNEAGARVVVKAYGPILVNGAVDSTNTIRGKVQVASDVYKKVLAGVETREHWGILLEEYGLSLREFSSRREFLSVFIDAITGHRDMHDIRKILHRDISFRNILIREDHETPAGRRRGLLIDFDYGVTINRTDGVCLTGHRTGTLPYMAIEILTGALNIPHRSRHDLESFFYVILWSCVVLAGPGLWREGQFKLTNTPLHHWSYGQDLHQCGVAKGGQITHTFDYILKFVHPYFDFMKGPLTELRECLFTPDAKQDVSYEKVLGILTALRDPLPELDDPHPVDGYVDHLAYPPKSGAAAQGQTAPFAARAESSTQRSRAKRALAAPEEELQTSSKRQKTGKNEAKAGGSKKNKKTDKNEVKSGGSKKDNKASKGDGPSKAAPTARKATSGGDAKPAVAGNGRRVKSSGGAGRGRRG